MRYFLESSKKLNSVLKKALESIPNTVSYKEDDGVTVYMKAGKDEVLLCDVITLGNTVMLTPVSVFGKKLERIIDQDYDGEISNKELSSVIFDLNDNATMKEIDTEDLSDAKVASKVVAHVKSLAKKLSAIL